MRRPSKLAVLIALLSVLALVSSVIAVGAVAQERNKQGPIESLDAANPESFGVQYSVKYICGWLPPVPPQDDQFAKPGDYMTSINIHDYTALHVNGAKRVTLNYRMGDPPPPVIAPFNFRVFARRTLTVDCVDIWAMAGLPPGTFLEGALHIGLDQPLPVTAVYTAQTHPAPEAGPDPGAGISIDVEQIVPLQAPIG